MVFEGKTIVSSMLKDPVAGPLIVSRTTIEGDSFANPNYHGTSDSVVYALGLPQALEVLRQIGRDDFHPGGLGENLTLSDLDEREVSAGDRFRVGSVYLEASFPRIPCGKVNFRLCHPEGQKAMQISGRSGVYFRVLEPGRIEKTDIVERVERAKNPFLISEIYRLVVAGQKFTREDAERMRANGALPSDFYRKLESKIENR